MLSWYKCRTIYIICFTLICIIFSICYAFNCLFYPSTISKHSASQIIAKDYYPSKYGTVITTKLLPNPSGSTSYATYVTQKYTFEDLVKEPGKTISQNKYIVKDGNFSYTPSMITLSNDKIKISATEHTGIKGNFDRIALANLPKWTVKNNHDTTITTYIESINETVLTPAGKFEDCIKTTNIVKSPKQKTLYLTSYYAKGLGVILHKKGTNLFNQEKLFELYSYHIPEKELDKANEFPIYKIVKNESNNQNVFINNHIGLEFPIPESFHGNYTVNNTKWQDNIESCININLKYKSMVYQPILSLIKLKKGYGIDYLNKTKNMQYLGERNGYTYCYVISNDINENVYSDPMLYKTYTNMIESIPYLIRNVKFK